MDGVKLEKVNASYTVKGSCVLRCCFRLLLVATSSHSALDHGTIRRLLLDRSCRGPCCRAVEVDGGACLVGALEAVAHHVTHPSLLFSPDLASLNIM